MSAIPAPVVVQAPPAESALRRELYFFTLYRLLEATLLAFAVFGPIDALSTNSPHPLLAVVVAAGYAVASLLLFLLRRQGPIGTHALVGVGADIVAAALAIHALPQIATAVLLMLLFNIAAAALLLPLRVGLAAAGTAVVILLGEYFGTAAFGSPDGRGMAEPVMFTLVFLAAAALTSLVGRQMRASQALAERRGAEAQALAEVNELILRRLRTGVVLVDGRGHVRLANEAAMLLLGEAGDRIAERSEPWLVDLARTAPELSMRLIRWLADGHVDESPLKLAPDMPEVVPRFARLSAGSDQVLVFLDDASLLSRRAESITLATLGRFAASLAHEIRNPLAAINYAVQLLEESRDIPSADRRLLEIIRQQGSRMNGIVENVLGLARREPAKPEHLELVEFATRFVDEYAATHPLENDTLRVATRAAEVATMFDPRQLHQAVTVLVTNALRYGRQPGEPARVTVEVGRDDQGAPYIDVCDGGPGISDNVASQLFRPFFTTSGHGTGLGLYIARELCRSNQATLDYLPSLQGGARFRLRMSAGSMRAP